MLLRQVLLLFFHSVLNFNLVLQMLKNIILITSVLFIIILFELHLDLSHIAQILLNNIIHIIDQKHAEHYSNNQSDLIGIYCFLDQQTFNVAIYLPTTSVDYNFNRINLS